MTKATLSGFDGSSADWVLDTSILALVDLYPTSSGISYTMERLAVPQLLAYRRNTTAATSPSLFYALAGNNTLMFHPAPGSADTFTAFYVPVPTALSSGTDDPSTASLGGIPAAYHKAIEYFACSEAADANDDESSQNGMKYFQLYQTQIQKIRRHMRHRGGQRLPRAKPTGPLGILGHYPNHDNSVYPGYRS